MSAYGAVPAPAAALQPARIYALEKKSNTYTHMVCIHVRADAIPPALEEAMCSSYNETLLQGDTYPFRDPMDAKAFRTYFCAYDVVVGVLVSATGKAFVDGAVVALPDVLGGRPGEPRAALLRDAVAWAAQLGGFYYIKPNYPGRSSHICNAGFIVPTTLRGLRLGSTLARNYLVLAPALGYRASVFNLVYETNVASVKIWERLGFAVVGRIPKAGLLKRPETDAEAFVDALVVYKEFASTGT